MIAAIALALPEYIRRYPGQQLHSPRQHIEPHHGRDERGKPGGGDEQQGADNPIDCMFAHARTTKPEVSRAALWPLGVSHIQRPRPSMSGVRISC